MSEKKGLPAIAWVAIGCGGLLLLGAIGFAGFTYFVVGKAKSALEDFSEDPTMFAATTWARHTPEVELVDSDRVARTITIRTKDGEELTLDARKIEQGDFVVRNAAGEIVFGVDTDTSGGSGSVRITGPGGTEVLTAEGSDGQGSVRIRSLDGSEVLSAESNADTGTVSLRDGSGEEVLRAQSGTDGDGTVTLSGQDGEHVVFRSGEEAEASIGDAALRYPGSEVKGSVSYGENAGVMTFETRDDPREVYDFYLERLPRDGFAVRSQTWHEQQGTEGGLIAGFNEGAGRSQSVTISGKDGVTTIVVQYQDQP